MKRRDFLKLGGTTVSAFKLMPAAALLSCGSDGNDDNANGNDDNANGNDDNADIEYGVINSAERVTVNESNPYTMRIQRTPEAGMVQGIPLNYRTYNGKFPPDTLVARPGDQLKITLVNELEPSVEDDFHPTDVNIPHGFNNVNLHTHGFNVSPRGLEDDVLHVVKPGETFEHEINIPADHPSGTFWYHPHKHGSALHQLASGMAGFLIIEGGEDDLRNIPEIAAAREVELSFHELIVGITADNLGTVPNEGTPGVDVVRPEDPDELEAFYKTYEAYSRNPIYSLFTQESYLQYTLNGMAVDEGVQRDANGIPIPGTATPPELNMAPGEVQHWRFGMLCHLQTYRFKLVNKGDPTNEDHIPLRVAAWDGITAETLTSHEELITGPGNRLDLIIKAPTTPGTYQFKMLFDQFGADGNGTNINEFPVAFDDEGNPTFWLPVFTTPGIGSTELVVLQVNIVGEVNDMELPDTLNPPSSRLPPIEDEEISRHRTIEFKVDGQMSINFDAGPDDVMIIDDRQFTINNTPFNGYRINETMLLGDAEEWTITNIHTGPMQFRQINHPFHIHVNWIYLKEEHHPVRDANGDHVLDAEGNPVFTVHEPNYWADTIDVPHGGKVIIRHRFENYTGIFPMHCHVIAHEDEGMMHLCEVVDATPVTTLISSESSGSVSCHAKTSNAVDAGSRLTVNFPAESIEADTSVTYQFTLEPLEPVPDGQAILERSFSLTATQALADGTTATVTVHYAMALSQGNGFDPETVGLWVFDGSEWTQSGITEISLDQDNGVLVATIDNSALANQHFTVLADETTIATTPYDNLAGGVTQDHIDPSGGDGHSHS